jgi:hypothetical protein
VRQIRAEKPPGADLPYFIDLATGDAAELYETEQVASVAVTDWDGSPVTGLTITSGFFTNSVALRVTGGTESATPYRIKVAVTTTPSGYLDEVFIELWVRRPTPTPSA